MKKQATVSIVSRIPNYSADYDKLFEEYPPKTLKPGRTITFDEISDAIALPIDDERFAGVVRGWVKRLTNEYRVHSKKTEDGVYILTNDQIYDKGERQWKTALRGVGRAIDTLRDVDVKAFSPEKRDKCLLLRKQAANAQVAAIVKENFEFRLSSN